MGTPCIADFEEVQPVTGVDRCLQSSATLEPISTRAHFKIGFLGYGVDVCLM
jgi:hypothetical protein